MLIQQYFEGALVRRVNFRPPGRDRIATVRKKDPIHRVVNLPAVVRVEEHPALGLEFPQIPDVDADRFDVRTCTVALCLNLGPDLLETVGIEAIDARRST